MLNTRKRNEQQKSQDLYDTIVAFDNWNDMGKVHEYLDRISFIMDKYNGSYYYLAEVKYV